ncbi:hypothetical protein BBJ28_00006627 [Nothophytophthora sp. Chile5]|nr:hypothetical protein BBJ28_00006627 [Nothophytophthora sp. Chile5]
MKRQVLQLYAQCLRSARKCPQWEQREMMKAYVKMKFQAEVGTRDPDRVRMLLADARDELERMNYYHSVYEAKQRADAAAREGTASVPTSGVSTGGDFTPPVEQRDARCPQCNTAYPSAQANFCSNCGAKRTTSS